MSLALISTSGTFTTDIVEGDKAETIAPIVSGTVVTATGTAVTFTGIPAWAKRITINISQLSTTGASPVLVRIGSGALLTTGYLSVGSTVQSGNGANSVNFTTGFGVEDVGSAGYTRSGSLTISKLAGTTWVISGNITSQLVAPVRMSYAAGSAALAGVLDRVAVTTVGGTETFDAGNINITWE